MSASDDLHSIIKMVAEQQVGNHRAFAYAHIASYDPTLHRVRVVFPTLRNGDGAPVLSPWMPLATVWAGAGFGMQVAPYGGASITDPTAGEPCVIELIGRKFGAAATAHLYFNGQVTPPLTTLQPGEALLQHKTGSLLHFLTTGDVQLTTAGNLSATVGGNLTATVTGTAAVYAAAIKLGKQAADSLLTLLTSAFATLYNGHTHDYSGGVTNAPNQQATSAQETSIVTAE